MMKNIQNLDEAVLSRRYGPCGVSPLQRSTSSMIPTIHMVQERKAKLNALDEPA
jgi:hypothetical protein